MHVRSRFAAVVLGAVTLALYGGASSAAAGGMGYNRVVAIDLILRKAPMGVYYGLLHQNEHFNVQYISPAGWGWGYAYGSANKCGWVDVSYLVTSPGDPHGTPPDCGPHRNIP